MKNLNCVEHMAFGECVNYSFADWCMRKREQIVPIILAAGASRGLPFPKALAPFRRWTALEIAVRNCKQVAPPVVVLGSSINQIRGRVPSAAKMLFNRNWRRGQLSSLRCALKRVPKGSAFLIYPVDLPLLRSGTMQRLVRAFRGRTPIQEIVMPRNKRKYGHPVIVSAAVRAEFLKAKTAREVIYRVPERIRVVPMRTDAIYEDFQTLASYQKCLRRFAAY
jgi:CTP:molybdopterin cytidylyltransferase MocA